MAKTVLITGATGLIGRHLTRRLLAEGYQVNILSRQRRPSEPGVRSFLWDLDKGTVDEKCIDNVEAIFHLAGEDIAAKPWRKERKHQIIKSRTGPIRLLYKLIAEHPQPMLKTIISASAIGYYGDQGDKWLTESDSAGTDFLARTCQAWETAADEGEALGLRIVKLRTGIVFTAEGGILKLIARTIKAGLGTALGSGRQWVSWVHIADVAGIYHYVLEHPEATGPYNLVAPAPLTNLQLIRQLASILGKHVWLPKVPAFLLRLILGEMSTMVLNSTRASSDKITELGYRFRFHSPAAALKQIFHAKKTSR